MPQGPDNAYDNEMTASYVLYVQAAKLPLVLLHHKHVITIATSKLINANVTMVTKKWRF